MARIDKSDTIFYFTLNPMMSEARREFFGGLLAEAPILLGVVPFGVIYGIIALEAGLTEIEAQAMSFIVFAGSAQFVMAQLLDLGTPYLVIIFTAVMLNLRHALYSASVAPYLASLSARWRWLLAYLLTDEAYAVTITHYQKEGPVRNKHWFYLGSGLALWMTWQLSTAVGIRLGTTIPASWSLDFIVALSFIALVVPALEDRAAVIAAVSAGITAVVLFSLPLRLGLVAAAIIGVVIGLIFESAWPISGEMRPTVSGEE